MSLQDAARIHALFHGKPATKATRVSFVDPTEFVVLGRAVAIEYECDKVNGAPTHVAGKKATYRHKLGKGALLVTDQTKRTLYIIGPKTRVTARGIVD